MSIYDHDSITILGRVGSDAEMRYLQNGNPVTSFSVAVDRSYKDKNGEQIKRVIWYRVSIFGKFAETCANITKGEKVFILGTLTPDVETGGPRVWERQDGSPASSFEVNASIVRFLSGKRDAKKQSSEEEDMPF